MAFEQLERDRRNRNEHFEQDQVASEALFRQYSQQKHENMDNQRQHGEPKHTDRSSARFLRWCGHVGA